VICLGIGIQCRFRLRVPACRRLICCGPGLVIVSDAHLGCACQLGPVRRINFQHGTVEAGQTRHPAPRNYLPLSSLRLLAVCLRAMPYAASIICRSVVMTASTWSRPTGKAAPSAPTPPAGRPASGAVTNCAEMAGHSVLRLDRPVVGRGRRWARVDVGKRNVISRGLTCLERAPECASGLSRDSRGTANL
jgi:hypothetical protein